MRGPPVIPLLPQPLSPSLCSQQNRPSRPAPHVLHPFFPCASAIWNCVRTRAFIRASIRSALPLPPLAVRSSRCKDAADDLHAKSVTPSRPRCFCRTGELSYLPHILLGQVPGFRVPPSLLAASSGELHGRQPWSVSLGSLTGRAEGMGVFASSFSFFQCSRNRKPCTVAPRPLAPMSFGRKPWLRAVSSFPSGSRRRSLPLSLLLFIFF